MDANVKQPTREEEWIAGSLSIVPNHVKISCHVYITLGGEPNQQFNIQLGAGDIFDTGCYGDVLIWEPKHVCL